VDGHKPGQGSFCGGLAFVPAGWTGVGGSLIGGNAAVGLAAPEPAEPAAPVRLRIAQAAELRATKRS